MDKIPMTKNGYEILKKELKQLVSKERPSIIKAIASARELGDLSENAEYHAARERQSYVEGRISYLENQLALAEIIDPSKIKQSKVAFGATIKLEDQNTEKKVSYTIVGEDEADIKEFKISYTSPIARALIGKEIDDEVVVKAPGGDKEYIILDISYS